jgi:crotonobetainyl-CoA:carnitine CoA-transferase CaiB-like acyl-CoA transferase
MPQIRPPALFGGVALPAVRRAPYLGEHTDELLGAKVEGQS